MRKIFVVSDTHFNHANILTFTDDAGAYFRGQFKDASHMNEHMIECWNSVVGPQDIVYHLGDVYFGSPAPIGAMLRRLQGRKRLILGNHDNGKCKVLQEHFQKITSSRQFREYEMILTHRPTIIPGGKWTINVHGHIHQNLSPTPKHVNVSVEAIDYTPRDIEEIYEETK
jgi:calcineurin-like phosphoesterase family protein